MDENNGLLIADRYLTASIYESGTGFFKQSVFFIRFCFYLAD